MPNLPGSPGKDDMVDLVVRATTLACIPAVAMLMGGMTAVMAPNLIPKSCNFALQHFAVMPLPPSLLTLLPSPTSLSSLLPARLATISVKQVSHPLPGRRRGWFWQPSHKKCPPSPSTQTPKPLAFTNSPEFPAPSTPQPEPARPVPDRSRRHRLRPSLDRRIRAGCHGDDRDGYIHWGWRASPRGGQPRTPTPNPKNPELQTLNPKP